MLTWDLGLRILGLHRISINSAVLSSLVPRLLDEIRIFMLVDIPVEMQAFSPSFKM